MLYNVNISLFSYNGTTENGSTVLNGCPNPLPVSPLKQVCFHELPDTSISLEKISTSDSNKTKPTARKSSIISLSELKLIRYKLAVAFGIFCIVALFLLPVIFHYVEGNSEVIGKLSLITEIGIVNISQVCIQLLAYICIYVCIHA